MAVTFKLTETKANLFHLPHTYSLAHAVSADFETAKGSLAWQIGIIFGHVDNKNTRQFEVGNVAALEHNSRFIYFLVTKETFAGRSNYDNIESALICLREHMRNHGIVKVALPRICCGNDRLDWHRVKDIISRVFHAEFNVEIMICEHRSPNLSMPKCQIVEVKGDLFSAPAEYSLVHSISADLAMCRGIALEFKSKFGRVNELQKQNKRTGNVAVLRDNDRYIYNLITKERDHDRCTYPALFYALVAMREHMDEHNVTQLAIPMLGCADDRLDWNRVKNMLKFAFADDHVKIVAYVNNRANSVTREVIGIEHSRTCKQNM